MKKVNYHIIRIGLLFAIALLFSIASYAQQPIIKTTVDKSSILIGQPINYKIAIFVPDDSYHFSWSTLPESVPHFEIISRGKLDSSIKDGVVQYEQNIALTSFDSGRMVIPSVPFQFIKEDDNSSLQLFSDSVAIQVTYSPMDSIQPFHDIKDIILVKAGKHWWLWVLISVGIILLIVLIWLGIKFFKKKEVSTQLFSSTIPPFEEAMKALSQLKEQPLLSPQNVKEFHTALTVIFKRYLSRTTNQNKLHLTSDEILMELKTMGFTNELLVNYANSIRMSNAVKFAKFLPSISENENCCEQTKLMVTAIRNLTDKKVQDDF